MLITFINYQQSKPVTGKSMMSVRNGGESWECFEKGGKVIPWISSLVLQPHLASSLHNSQISKQSIL
ncbi:unnamed protein product [Brassica oleracea]